MPRDWVVLLWGRRPDLGRWSCEPGKVSCRKDPGAKNEDEFGRNDIPKGGKEGMKAGGKWRACAWIHMTHSFWEAKLDSGGQAWGTDGVRSSVCKRQACMCKPQ